MMKNNIPIKTRKAVDEIWEHPENTDFVESAGLGYRLSIDGEWVANDLVLKGSISFITRQLHHIDQDTSNNELWNFAPLTYDEHLNIIHMTGGHIQKINSKVYRETCKSIYFKMLERLEAIYQTMKSQGRQQYVPNEVEYDKFLRLNLDIEAIEKFEGERVKIKTESCPF